MAKGRRTKQIGILGIAQIGATDRCHGTLDIADHRMNRPQRNVGAPSTAGLQRQRDATPAGWLPPDISSAS
jgi:hypothetical protein